MLFSGNDIFTKCDSCIVASVIVVTHFLVILSFDLKSGSKLAHQTSNLPVNFGLS